MSTRSGTEACQVETVFVPELRNQIIADVFSAPAMLVGPILPSPNLRILLDPHRIRGQIGASEPLEIRPLLSFRDSGFTIGMEKIING